MNISRRSFLGASLASLAAPVLGAGEGRPALRFGFLTDTHVERTVDSCARVRKALELFRSKGVELIVHTGDVANAHYPDGYRAYRQVFDEVFAGVTPPRQITAVGNHDTQMELNGLTQAQAAVETLQLLGVENVHTDTREVNGYAFLTMPYNVGGEGFLSWADYEARVKAACEAHPGRPVFVCEHEPPQDTVYNSHNWGWAQSRAIFEKYPQVVELSGHVHGSLRNDQFIWQGAFTVVNACCINAWQGLLDGQAAKGGQSKPSNAVLVLDVYADRIVARRWDILDGTEICPESPWTIPLPFAAATAPYNRARLVADEVAPAFASGAALTAVAEGDPCQGVRLTFPQVEGAMTYWLTAQTRNTSGAWTEIAHAEMFSDFWMEPADRTGTATYLFPETLLAPGELHRFTVQPRGQYGAKGPALDATLTTPADLPSQHPDAFVEYIESTGVQYLDTGVRARSGTKAEIDGLFTAVGPDVAFLDARGAWNTDTRVMFFHTANAALGMGYGSFIYPTRNGARIPLEANRRYHVVTELNAGLQTLDLDGARVYSAADARTVETDCNLFLFANNVAGAADNCAPARCYGLKIWQDGVLVRDFRPCRKNGLAGLYDQVSHRVFTGAETKAAGPHLLQPPTPVVAGKPDAWIEYVESDGAQWLHTGVTADAGLVAEGEMSWTEIGYDHTFLGACLADGGSRLYFVHAARDAGQWLGYGAVGIYGAHAPVWTTNRKYAFKATLAPGVQTLEVDGATTVSRNESSEVSTGVGLYLHACDKGGQTTYASKTRCYGLKLSRSGELLRDFRPCLKDGRAGLYDAVSDRIFFPGVDYAKWGPVTAIEDSVRPTAWLEYVDSDGAQYVDTGVRGRGGLRAYMDMEWLKVSDDWAFLDARASLSTETRVMFWHTAWSSAALAYGGFVYPGKGGGVASSTADRLAVAANTRYRVTTELKAGAQTMDIVGGAYGGRVYTAAKTDDVDAGVNLTLFGNNVGGVVANLSKARLHRVKIWRDGEPVRDFRPVMTNIGAAMLWDAVERKLYLSSTGGFASHGPETGRFEGGTTIFVD